MNNVQPGDLAKIVGEHLRAGTLVLVQRLAQADEMAELLALNPGWSGRVLWMCDLLQGAPAVGMRGTRAYLLPGDEVFVADRHLQRIPPEQDPGAVPAPPIELGVAA